MIDAKKIFTYDLYKMLLSKPFLPYDKLRRLNILKSEVLDVFVHFEIRESELVNIVFYAEYDGGIMPRDYSKIQAFFGKVNFDESSLEKYEEILAFIINHTNRWLWRLESLLYAEKELRHGLGAIIDAHLKEIKESQLENV